jgi:hypothetical protein
MQCGIIFQIAPASDFPKLPTILLKLHLPHPKTKKKKCITPQYSYVKEFGGSIKYHHFIQGPVILIKANDEY